MNESPSDPASTQISCAIISAFVVGIALMTMLAASNRFGRYFGRDRAVSLLPPLVLVLAVWLIAFIIQKTGLVRREVRRNADEEIAFARERIRSELELATANRCRPNTTPLWRRLGALRRYLPDRPEVDELEQLLRDGEAAAAADTSRLPGTMNDSMLDVAVRSFRERGIVAVCARIALGLGVLLSIVGGATASFGCCSAAFLSYWIGLGLLLRRQSFIVAVGGSLIAALVLAMPALITRSGRW